jgi:hypothetical protein
MEPLGYSLARWVGGGWDAIERADKVRESVADVVTRSYRDGFSVAVKSLLTPYYS